MYVTFPKCVNLIMKVCVRTRSYWSKGDYQLPALLLLGVLLAVLRLLVPPLTFQRRGRAGQK